MSSWTDNEDQEADGEEDEGPGSSSVRGAVSAPLVAPAALLERCSPEDVDGRVRDASLKYWDRDRDGRGPQGIHLFIYFSGGGGSGSSRQICEGNDFHLRQNIDTGTEVREPLCIKFSVSINF